MNMFYAGITVSSVFFYSCMFAFMYKHIEQTNLNTFIIQHKIEQTNEIMSQIKNHLEKSNNMFNKELQEMEIKINEQYIT